jgi:hypothetical protein
MPAHDGSPNSGRSRTENRPAENLSALARSTGFSTERLMHFLTMLGRDIEIAVKPVPRSRRRGHLRVVTAQ